MYSVEDASKVIAHHISISLNMDDEKEEIIAYGAFSFLETMSSILLVCIFGIIFHVLVEALTISFIVSIFRKYSGGAHSNSANRCTIIGLVLSVGMALIEVHAIGKLNIKFVIPILCTSYTYIYYLIYKLAPVDSEQKPILKIEKRQHLKKSSLVILTIYLIVNIIFNFLYIKYNDRLYLIYGECIFLGLSWQTFTLTKKGHSFIKFLDDVF
jgi:Membrane protein putatively involved in post-translational modification of the autoinducing quorum-sensing peptide